MNDQDIFTTCQWLPFFGTADDGSPIKTFDAGCLITHHALGSLPIPHVEINVFAKQYQYIQRSVYLYRVTAEFVEPVRTIEAKQRVMSSGHPDQHAFLASLCQIRITGVRSVAHVGQYSEYSV